MIASMSMIPLDPRITVKLLEGYENTLDKMVQEREQFYNSQSCPYCKGQAFVKTADIRRMFSNEDPLPRFQLRCLNCTCIWDPFTGMIEKLGNLALAFEPAFPMIDGEDK